MPLKSIKSIKKSLKDMGITQNFHQFWSLKTLLSHKKISLKMIYQLTNQMILKRQFWLKILKYFVLWVYSMFPGSKKQLNHLIWSILISWSRKTFLKQLFQVECDVKLKLFEVIDPEKKLKKTIACWIGSIEQIEGNYFSCWKVRIIGIWCQFPVSLLL